MDIDPNGLVVLDRHHCLRLLGRAAIGRVAVSIGALPAVFPVNYVVDNGDIVFRTGQGTKLEAALCNTVVAFEVDAVDPISHTGWSVLVTGHARTITDPDELAAVWRLPLQPWASNGRDTFVRIRGELVSGRRLDPIVALRVNARTPT